ncbi:MAG: xanthine dehydrogenase family protein molybdopterin-binding subunit [Sphingomonadales bacterium]|nr:xanthine dehydrogenase family protein molybdopterin-binding subunit [Sphingomonadales bacterium]
MADETNPIQVSRRDMLRAAATAAPVLAIGIRFGTAQAATTAPADFKPNALLTIDGTGQIALALPKTEMGQGVYTSLTMLVAEELEVAPQAIRVDIPRGESGLFGKLDQGTGGSTSIRECWEPMRQAAANARAALVDAAAARWKVPASECRAQAGSVVHAASKRTAPYGALVAAAAALPVPEKAPLKTAADGFKVIGKPQRRLDSRAKVIGTAEYGIDVRLPGMKVATLAQSPVFGGKLGAADEDAAMKVKGVRKVVRLPDAVAVVADHYWAARKGLEALAPSWEDGANAVATQAAIVSSYAEAAQQPGNAAMGKDGIDAATLAKAMEGAVKRVSAVYEQPFLAHAAMEPGNCVVHVKDGGCEIWTGTQVPGSARDEAAAALGVPVEKVVLHNRLMGGGFGRRLEADYILRTIEVAKQVDAPVKLVWSREEDMQHDLYRPFYHDQIEAGLDAEGKPVAWNHKITGSSIMARLYPKYFKGVDADAVDGSVKTPYTLPAQMVEYVRHESAVPTSWWRGVGGARSAFVVESFVDELAYVAGKDPLAYRRALASDPRAQAVLDLVAEKSGWAKPAPAGRARGVALIHTWDTYMAQVVEVEKDAENGVRVVKVTAAVDCGQPINPLGIEAQVEGGIVFGITAALFGEVTIANGRIEQSNFHDYRMLRISEAPAIATYIVPSDQKAGGMGEPPVATIMPALANAVFALTGKRIRKLPIAKALTA